MSDYAWIITTDHLAREGERSDAGKVGPRTITPEQIAALAAGKGRTFYLYDDDRERYYSGRAIWSPDFEGTEQQVFGPLDDFGAPNAGCTLIKWHGDADYS